MKVLLVCLCLTLAAHSAWVTFPQPPEPEFSQEDTYVISQKSSPDGSVIASYVVKVVGLSSPFWAVTLYSRGQGLPDSLAVISNGNNLNPIEYGWTSSEVLEVRLPCGWWARLTNHYQVRSGTGRIVDIRHLPPSSECEQTPIRSTALPN